MKYIRIRDNICGERIYENDIPEPKNEHEKEVLRKLKNNIGEIVIKEADTIEELCDEFVWSQYGSGYLYKSFLRVKCAYCHEPLSMDGNGDIFGAIWTDKGLIYVAKMNEKGELELL